MKKSEAAMSATARPPAPPVDQDHAVATEAMYGASRGSGAISRRRAVVVEDFDVVVTVPKDRWFEWIEEGDLPGDDYSGREYVFTTRAITTDIGARLYIVSWGRLRGYAPVTGAAWAGGSKIAIYRAGDAVACTIDEKIKGFQGARRRWWDRRFEKPFPNWQTEGVEQ